MPTENKKHTKNTKPTFMDDYPEVRIALKKKIDSYRVYWTKSVELMLLSAWWLMVLVCVGTLCMNVVSRWMYRNAIKLTARVLDKTAHWNDNNSRVRVIKDRKGEEDYLIRHYMLLQDRENFPFNVFLHKFMKGDEEDIHDHPWGFFHLILSGGYYEHITTNEDGIGNAHFEYEIPEDAVSLTVKLNVKSAGTGGSVGYASGVKVVPLKK